MQRLRFNFIKSTNKVNSTRPLIQNYKIKKKNWLPYHDKSRVHLYEQYNWYIKDLYGEDNLLRSCDHEIKRNLRKIIMKFIKNPLTIKINFLKFTFKMKAKVCFYYSLKNLIRNNL